MMNALKGFVVAAVLATNVGAEGPENKRSFVRQPFPALKVTVPFAGAAGASSASSTTGTTMLGHGQEKEGPFEQQQQPAGNLGEDFPEIVRVLSHPVRF